MSGESKSHVNRYWVQHELMNVLLSYENINRRRLSNNTAVQGHLQEGGQRGHFPWEFLTAVCTI